MLDNPLPGSFSVCVLNYIIPLFFMKIIIIYPAYHIMRTH